MKKPSVITYMLASSPVFFGTVGLSIWLLYQWWLDPGIWPLIVMLGLWCATVVRADERVTAYRSWKAEWDMLDGKAPRPARRGTLIGLLAVLLIAAFPTLAKLPPATQNAGTLAVLLLIVAFFVLRALWRWVRSPRRPRRTKREVVTVVVKAPIFPVPTLEAAYRALPEHCQQLA